jgi:hypothetical protein
VRGEPWVSVGYHFLGESEPLIDVVQIKVGDAFPRNGGRTGEEDGRSCASVVDYREYGVVWAVSWELCDEIHRYLFEWVCLGVRGDTICRGVCLVRQVFVLLAGSASFDVVFNPPVHARPPVPSFRGLYGFISPWVPRGRRVVVMVHDPPSQVQF